jgi:hypothetical protein
MADERKTKRWWMGLCAVSVLNAGLWLLAASIDAPLSEYRSIQLVLSGIFVAICAFRSFFPRVDLERICMWDTSVSTIFVGRLAATVAEMCFAAQCALFLAKLGEVTGLGYIKALSYLIVPLIVLAQVACWYAVIVLNHLGHAIEEILWTSMVAILCVGYAASLFHIEGPLQLTSAVGIVACGGAAILMSAIDVPMYVARWRRGKRDGIRYLSLAGGLRDTLTRRHATRRWSDWRGEVPWMTLYFSIGVWLSIGLSLVAES